MTLELYTQSLMGSDMRAFQVACDMLKNTPRQDGETAFPDFGTILAAMDDARERFPLFSEGATEVNTKPIFVDPTQKRLK